MRLVRISLSGSVVPAGGSAPWSKCVCAVSVCCCAVLPWALLSPPHSRVSAVRVYPRAFCVLLVFGAFVLVVPERLCRTCHAVCRVPVHGPFLPFCYPTGSAPTTVPLTGGR